jgi:hypothetical protein
MGLNLWVGTLGSLAVERGNEETYEIWRREFASVNSALIKAGLPSYNEPENAPATDRTWYGRIGSWRHIQTVRWVAASVALTGERPSHETGADAPDALNRYESDLVHSGGLIKHLGSVTCRTSFDHLICHADNEGFYVPVDFERVISNDEVGLLGSSHRLVAECDVLARFLEIPTDIPADPNLLNEAIGDPKRATETWQRFGDATRACQQLRMGARKSIRYGAALVFG